MEGFAYSYPDSGDSSPRSREVDFDNPSAWEDQPPPPLPPNHKVKFLLSYGGKIQPRPHDNLLSYVGGETKILAVDRSVKFSTLLNKLTSLLAEDSSYSSLNPISPTSFKYQLPGEDLDSLISVTNDDDLEHMMHEYDRLYRASPKAVRLRLFAFPGPQSRFGSTGSDPEKLDRECFVEALDSVPVPAPIHPPHGVDLLFGSENRGVGPVHLVKGQDRVIGSDPQIEARIQEMNRLHISTQEQGMRQPASYRPRSEENLVGAVARDTHHRPTPTIPASVQFPASYWQPSQEHQQPPPLQPPPPQQQQPPPPQQQHQPVYMIHHAPPPPGSAYPAPPSSGSGYHAPVARPVASQPAQGYYQIQRVPSDAAYREQPVYNVNTSQPLSAPPPPVPGYSEGMGVPVRPVAGIAENTGGYQVVYDSATGRQVYYAAPGGAGVGVVTAPFQGVGVGAPGGSLTSTEGKAVTRISPNSAAL